MTLILWSGGCDSTLLLFEHATKALAAGENPPRALSISYDDQIPAGQQHRKARQAILKEFRRRGLKVDHAEVSFQKSGPISVEPAPGLPQAILWTGIAQTFLMRDEDLYLAYIRGDDIWHYRQWLFDAFGSTQIVLQKDGKLQLPLEWMAKDEVLKELDAAGLLELTWYCETARGTEMKPCGWCASCKTMSAARHLAKSKWGYDKPPEPETQDESKQPQSSPRPSRQAQRPKALSRRRRTRPAAQNSTRKTARPRRLR